MNAKRKNAAHLRLVDAQAGSAGLKPCPPASPTITITIPAVDFPLKRYIEAMDSEQRVLLSAVAFGLVKSGLGTGGAA